MQFIVPQFLDVEDKIIGPLTFKQFIYLAGGGGLAFSVYRLLPLIISIPLALAIVAIALALTFYKINGKPFVIVFQAFLSFVFQSKLYIWKKQQKKEVQKKDSINQTDQVKKSSIPRLSESQLSDLSWSLDILDMKQKDK